ncbi:MAG: glutamate--tRNA ligase [Phycisphaerales bacterium]|nr:MAG: glutamate--tRNA ligase [Phycisphaerales bacterium]
MSTDQTVVTRFAPSPSGHLHVGGARTALYNWAFARKHGGRFILRIEDTDRKRSSDQAGLAFLDDLRWLGIDWDEGPEHDGCGGGETGPYHQSQRLEIYQRFIDQLIKQGRAYPAFETPEEIDAARERARQEKRNYRYDRAALQLDAATVQQYLDEGRPHVIRFRMPDDREITVNDQVLGEVTKSSNEYEDFVIRKADGYPTYHFAVVVDDALMNVTHVIRAQEHLNNTHRHLMLQEALGFPHPTYAHLSVVANPNGSKMSKRDKDKALRAAVLERQIASPPQIGDGLAVREEEWSWWMEDPDRQLETDAANALAEVLDVQLPEINVDDFRRSGYLPEVLINYLALLGWNPGGDIEKFDAAFLCEHFALDRVIKSPARFDREKLLAFNLDALQEMPENDFAARLRHHAERYHPAFLDKLGEEDFATFAAANQSRSKTLDDCFRSDRFFVMDDDQITYEVNKSVRKALVNGEPNGITHLEGLLHALRDLKTWDSESIEAAVKQYTDEHADGKLGKVAQPLRIAVTGGTVSPAIFDTLKILGRESTLARIERCLLQKDEITQPVS